MSFKTNGIAAAPSSHVLVFGDDTRSVLAVVRSLGRAGKVVHVAPFNWRAPALHSRYVTKVHHLPRYADDPTGWLRAVRGLTDAYGFDLLIPCCDRSMLPLNAQRERFEDCRIAMPDSHAIATLFDKQKTRELCSRISVPIARGRQLTETDTAEELAREFGLPLLLKAQSSYTLSALDRRGSVDLVATVSELATRLDERKHQPTIVEAFFTGEGVGVSVLADRGRIAHAFQHRRLHEQGTGGGSSLRISEPVAPQLLEHCRRIAEHLDLTGVSMFEFREDRSSGEAILLEVNARFWGSLPLAIAAGVDFPCYLYDLLVLDRQHPERPYRVGLRGRNTLRDLHAILSGSKEPRRELLRSPLIGKALRLGGFAAQPLSWLLGRERSDTFHLDDLRPAFAELFGAPAILSNHSWRRHNAESERRRLAARDGQPMVKRNL